MDCCNYMPYRPPYYGTPYYESMPYPADYYGHPYQDYYGNAPSYYGQHWQCGNPAFTGTDIKILLMKRVTLLKRAVYKLLTIINW